jgi:hypothetical protein
MKNADSATRILRFALHILHFALSYDQFLPSPG